MRLGFDALGNKTYTLRHMKKIFISLVVGCFVTWLMYLYTSHPRTGPTLGIILLILPFNVLTSIITKEEPWADFIYIGLQIGFWSLLCFPIVYAIGRWSNHKDH